ncbi:MAG: DUF5057 domain-containing protein [Roseburia sp.]|nr:DUF5057 domain-containing protein [Roseburia sp.]MCM1278056.1 DUF5057 domain-containing protein [Robinsoniella sp.]
MEKGKKKLIIRILSTAAVLAVAIAICTFVAKKATAQVEASTKVLQKVSDKYKSGDTFRILEVVPEHTLHENEEIGYFMEDGSGNRDFMEVSKAKSIGSFLAAEGVSNLLMMRDYGLIKDYGADYGNSAGHVSDNPVYSDAATFASYAMTGYVEAGRQLVYGVYENDSSMSGDYMLQDGYFIDVSGTINAMTGVVSGNNPPVSNNSIGGGALTRALSVISNTEGVTEETPGQDVPVVNEQEEVTVTVEDEEEEPAEEKEGQGNETPKEESPQNPAESGETENSTDGNMLQDIEGGSWVAPSQEGYGERYFQGVGAYDGSYAPVEEGDRFNKALPEGITYVGNGTGNVKFSESSAGKYFGYTTKNVYYNNNSNNYFHNGSWFKELVFGDKNININIIIETKTPDEISNDMKDYDLIYVSGSNETYLNNGKDFSDSQVMELYNAVISTDYKAVIMDYALIDTGLIADKAAVGSLSNMEKLALLLWQENQTAVLTDTISGNEASGEANNGFDVDIASNGELSILSYGSVSNITWHYLASQEFFKRSSNFVAGSVYVYEHRLSYFDVPKAQVDAYDFFGNGDFNSKYTETVIAAGLSRVEYMVRANNASNPTEPMNERITPAVVVQYILTYDGTASELVKNDLRVLEIEPCRDFSYNIGWGTQSYTDVKNSGNRYANECCANREEFVKTYLGAPFVKDNGDIEGQNIDRVMFTSMTIEEFICINGNVSEDYDIIYIGSNHSRNPAYDTYDRGTTGNYKTVKAKDDVGKSADTPEYITDFRDNLMDGMVYFNIGDITYYSEALPSGWGGQKLWGYFEGNRERQTSGETRFSARDLTVYKKKELLDFLENGYPIIVAGDMLKTDDSDNRIINPTINTGSSLTDTGITGIDHGRIDNCSEMYELFQIATGNSGNLESIGSYSSSGYDNFISEADALEAAGNPVTAANFKEKMAHAVNAAKLSMNVTARPTEYEYVELTNGALTSPKYLAASSDGKYYLEFEFTLQNFSINSTDSDLYTPKLYVDVNADGKFSETEELEGAVVTNALTNEEVVHTTDIRGSSYKLSTNVLYRLRREVPDGFQGVLPWCLKVQKSLTPNVSASETGYSAIRGASAATIKILQITLNGNEGGEGDNGSTLSLQYKHGLYGAYINQLESLGMFKLDITTINQTQYVNNLYPRKDANGTTIEEVRYYEALEDFDMLVLGFGDNYKDTQGNDFIAQTATDAIANYVASGRPVLLAHDFLEHYPSYKVVKTLRDKLGMDRYGLTSGELGNYLKQGTSYSKSHSGNAAAIAAIEGSGRRVAYQPGSNKRTLLGETQGLTNYFLMKFYKDKSGNTNKRATGNDYFPLLSPDMYDWGHPPAANSNQDYLVVIDKVNDGQITNYPYKLPDSFAVNRTHGQYFQPNMEADQDQDGTADITIWYTLAYGHGDNIADETNNTKLADGVYNISPKDGVNNYYIFNSGNVTYTGSGHSNLVSPQNKYEAQLFINTLVAAYRAGIKKPAVSIYDGSDLNSSAISNVVVPYDENVGYNASDTNKAESSILIDKADNTKYQYPFVSVSDANATKVWFCVSDPNLVKGSKKIQLKFWREVSDGTAGSQTITLDNGQAVTVVELRMPFYPADFAQGQSYAYGTDATAGVMYGLKLPMDLLKTNVDFKLYVEAETTIESVSITGDVNASTSGKSYAVLGVTKMDLLKLD